MAGPATPRTLETLWEPAGRNAALGERQRTGGGMWVASNVGPGLSDKPARRVG
jgi:hypothetical protein